MRIRLFTIGVLLCMPVWQVEATTLQEAMERAGKLHPELKISELNIEAAQGRFTEQSSYAYNPELSLEPQRRRLNAGGTSNDYYLTLSQGIEIGGKRGYREQSAQAALDAANKETEATWQRLSTRAARAFVELFFARQTLDLRSRQSVMLQQLSKAMEQRLEAGESNQLNANLARSSYTSALNAKTGAKQAFTLSQARYYVAIGRPQENNQPVNPELPRLLTDWKPPEDPFAIALASRPDLAALHSKLTQFNAQADLAGAQRIPDPTFSVMSGREAGEQLLLLGVNFPIPVLNSHRGAYRAAQAQAARAQDKLQWSERQLRFEVQAALDNHDSTMQAVASAFQMGGHQSAFDNIKLAQTAFEAGELDLEELVIHINQGLDARLTAMQIRKQGWLARIHLAEVLGHPEYILEGTK